MGYTRNDVAKLAGVGASTVSYVLSGKKRFSPEVEERVRSAVRELNYYPSYNAKQMKQERGETICYIGEGSINISLSELICGLEHEVVARNNWLSVKLDMNMEKLEACLPDLLSRKVDGAVLAFNPLHLDERILAKFLENGIKVIMVIPHYESELRIALLKPDYIDGMAQMVEHLYGFGHRKIGYLSFFRKDFPYDTRLPGYLDAMERHGLEPIYTVSNFDEMDDFKYREREFTTKGLAELLERGVTAVLFPNETTAFIGLSQLNKKGFRVPQDISIAGISETVYNDLTEPAITSLNFDYYRFGVKTAQMLFDYIDTDVCGVERYPLNLSVKESVGPVNNHVNRPKG